jgi:hypothetical protein
MIPKDAAVLKVYGILEHFSKRFGTPKTIMGMGLVEVDGRNC